MTTRTEVVGRLEAIGTAEVPAADQQFIDGLELRLRDGVDTLPVTLHAVDATGRSHRPRRAVMTMSGLAAAVVLVVGIVLASVQETTRVATPIGSGASVPALRDDTSDATEPADPADPTVSTTREDSGRGVERDGTAYGDYPADKRSDYADGEREEGASTEEAPPPGSWRYSEPSEERFDLKAEGSPTGAALEWERYEGERFVAYVVLRARGEDPEYPRRDTTTSSTQFVHRSESRDETQWSDTNPAVTAEYRYMVVVFDKTGEELARSNVAAVTGSVGLTVKLP